jgi:hypothetical protein
MGRSWTDEELQTYVASSKSWIEVIRKLGLVSLNNYTTVRKHAKRLELDHSHFLTVQQLTEQNLKKGLKYTKEQVFIENSSISQKTLREYVVRLKLLEYKCSECTNVGIHLGKPFSSAILLRL